MKRRDPKDDYALIRVYSNFTSSVTHHVCVYIHVYEFLKKKSTNIKLTFFYV